MSSTPCKMTGLCCHGRYHDRIHISPEDKQRWEDAGRGDLWASISARLACGACEEQPCDCGAYEGLFFEQRNAPGWSIPEGWFLELEDDDACPFLQGNLCGIHALKPDGCRLFEAGVCPGYLGDDYVDRMETE